MVALVLIQIHRVSNGRIIMCCRLCVRDASTSLWAHAPIRSCIAATQATAAGGAAAGQLPLNLLPYRANVSRDSKCTF